MNDSASFQHNQTQKYTQEIYNSLDADNRTSKLQSNFTAEYAKVYTDLKQPQIWILCQLSADYNFM